MAARNMNYRGEGPIPIFTSSVISQDAPRYTETPIRKPSPTRMLTPRTMAEGDDIKEWLNNFNVIKSANNRSDKTALRQLPAFVNKRVQLYLRDLNHSDTTWTDLCEELMMAFGGKNPILEIETVKELLAILKQTDWMIRLAKQEQDDSYKVYLMKQTSAPVEPEHEEEDIPVCRCCKLYGHFVRECPEAECYDCGGIGHISYDCPDRHVDDLSDY